MTSTGSTGAIASFAGRRVLVAEDEYFLAKDISRTLAKAGADVVGPFPELNEALAAVSAEQPLDAALLDVNLRGVMVFPVAAVLRRRGVPFVFTTGYDRSSLPRVYRDVPICEKPVDIAEFARHLALSVR